MIVADGASNALRGRGRGRAVLRSGASGLALLLMLPAAGAAFAQTAEPAPAPAPAATAETAAADAGGDIVVTASRIKRADAVTATPTIGVTAVDLAASGATDVASFINETPTFLAAYSPSANDSSGGAGSAFLDLRGLGPKRTLVLVNGRRHVPSNAGGTVDISVLPTIALERIDVVTGGASAAWGSDAVTGVVNVIYDRNLQGIRAEGQFGLSQEGDGRETRIALAAGGDFAEDRGHFVVAAEYKENSGILDQKDRSWGARGWAVIRNPADTGPNDGIPARLIRENVNLGIATEGGLILGPPPFGFREFQPDGSLVPFTPGTGSSGLFTIGGSGANFGQYASLLQPYDSKKAFVAVDYDLSDTITAFFEGGYGATAGHSDVVQSFIFGNIAITADNAFLPASLAQEMATAGIPAFALGRLNTDMGFVRTNRDQRMHRAIAGLKGELSDSWNWEAYVQYGKVTSTETLTNNLIPGNLALAADAVRDPAGNIVCRATLDPDPRVRATAAGCVPINLFGFGAPSAEAIDYVSGTSIYNSALTQTVVAGELGGDLVTLWAGPVKAVTGFEYRKEKFKGVGDTMGGSGEFFLGNGQDLAGSVTVKELFGEVLVPLLADLSFAKRLELSAAARYTDYDTIGSVTTWKLGFVWDTNQAFTFRGSLSRDIRAPNIGELFSPTGQSFLSPADPCDAASQAGNPVIAQNCAAAGLPANFAANNGLIKVLTGGNPDLEEERALTKTLGVVFAPRFLPGLQASVDWYDIKIKNAIQIGIPGQVILDQCYGGATFPNNYCNGVTRGADGQLVSVASNGLNTAQYRVQGVDWQLGYTFNTPALFEDGDATVRLGVLGTYLIERSDTASVRKIDRAGELRRDNSGLPKWRWNANAAYASSGFGFNTQVRYVGGGKYDNTWGPEDIDDNTIDAKWYVDVSARVPIKTGGAEYELFAGINNLFNNDPAIVPYELTPAPLATNPGLYDTIGRFFYGGVRIKL